MIHGTNSAYIYQKCRCLQCKHAHKEYQAVANAKYYRKNAEEIKARNRESGKRRRMSGDTPVPRKERKLTKMDLLAMQVWEKLKSPEPRPFRMFRSPLYDL